MAEYAFSGSLPSTATEDTYFCNAQYVDKLSIQVLCDNDFAINGITACPGFTDRIVEQYIKYQH